MKTSANNRHAVTLVELLVVIATIGTLLGLLVVAIVRVREAGARTTSQNNLRQLILGTHSFASAHNTQLPTVDGGPADANPQQSLFVAILPFIDQGVYDGISNSAEPYPVVGMFISPADPTGPAGIAAGEALSSYASNAQVFQNGPRLPGSIPDGASNTLAFAEHYAYMCGAAPVVSSFFYTSCFASLISLPRATFADYTGVEPITRGAPPISGPSSPVGTFQVAPTQTGCDPALAQTPHNSGMLVALMDGSVRVLAPSMSEATYWAAVTPAGGEMLGDDW